MSVWKGGEPFGSFIDDLAVELGRKERAPAWKETLSKHMFKTMDTLNTMDCEDWLAMDLPLEGFALMKKRAPPPGSTSLGECHTRSLLSSSDSHSTHRTTPTGGHFRGSPSQL